MQSVSNLRKKKKKQTNQQLCVYKVIKISFIRCLFLFENHNFIYYFTATAFVVTCMTTLTSKYGNFDQKGTVLGIFRSLGALARAIGPILSSTAFWSIGATTTYLIGGILLLYPTVKLHKLKLS